MHNLIGEKKRIKIEFRPEFLVLNRFNSSRKNLIKGNVWMKNLKPKFLPKTSFEEARDHFIC